MLAAILVPLLFTPSEASPVDLPRYPSAHAEHEALFGSRPRSPRARTTATPRPGLPDVTVYGYLPYWIDDVTDEELEGLTHVAVFQVALASDGSLTDTSRWTSVAPTLVPRAAALGVKVHLCVICFDDDTMTAVLASESKRATTIAELASLVEAYGADGVNVDFEGLPAAQKDNFVAFIQELAAAVDEVYLATPAVDWSGAFDYSALSAASDGLFIMGYDYHWSGGNPGPVAPLYASDLWGRYALDWTIDDYLTYGATADKIVLGLPLYGRWWPSESYDIPGVATADGEAVLMNEAVDLMATYGRYFEEYSRSPYTLYDGGQMWCDDMDSVQERVSWAVDLGLQGVGFWALGYEDELDGFWDMMAEETFAEGGEGEGEGEATTDDTGGGDGPVARAGEPFLAYPGDTVILDGSASEAPSGGALRFIWSQVAGEAVDLDAATTANPSFVADNPGTLTFELVVSADDAYSSPDTVDVIVVDPDAGDRYDKTGGACAVTPRGARWTPLAALALLLARRRRR